MVQPMRHSAGSTYKFYTKKSPALCGIAGDHGPALCGIARDQHIFVNFSANLKQNSKIFQCVHLWPRGNRLAKKTRGQKSCDTAPLKRFMVYKTLYAI
jgi:hypothetical protein